MGSPCGRGRSEATEGREAPPTANPVDWPEETIRSSLGKPSTAGRRRVGRTHCQDGANADKPAVFPIPGACSPSLAGATPHGSSSIDCHYCRPHQLAGAPTAANAAFRSTRCPSHVSPHPCPAATTSNASSSIFVHGKGQRAGCSSLLPCPSALGHASGTDLAKTARCADSGPTRVREHATGSRMGYRSRSWPVGSHPAPKGKPRSPRYSGTSSPIRIVTKRTSQTRLQRTRQTQARARAAVFASRALPTVCASAPAHGPASSRASCSAKAGRAPTNCCARAAVVPGHAERHASPAPCSGDIGRRETACRRLAANASTSSGGLRCNSHSSSGAHPKSCAACGTTSAREQEKQHHVAPQQRRRSSGTSQEGQ